MRTHVAATHTLVLGIGNILLSDDGIGVHVIRALDALECAGEIPHRVALRDGGTLGLSLFSEIEDFGSLIAVDAVELGAKPGTVRIFQGPEMDRQLTGKKRTAHEVALADLMSAARLTGCEPARRALVAVQPESTQWGLSLTPAVGAAILTACQQIKALLSRWHHDS
ncbi:HyaD/HybD family hydrogenase maturation endopeptidase [Bradyrhizobium sp. SZCCHNS1012]|uniref:HyaD/HybD family hydrogenase maturation endopeptidase n=1 Tax=Bradyrhizobium sp. SZCCHNS1012 TaxID=3057297 RepID=UPI002916F2F7|nr:HyaD/HybD family hydrogenase maturation endopeptidase [Bradyrhizobium sp. SZCCHNS1012]